ncbi:LysR family transcriptional regulator [Paraoerskovia sediminicola]|uniref:LysR family transcriptional regulator n=1 Tax=Paraoerskovia sediminicola TaxID=1138587 RepID=A0ABM8G4S1_9CELL|nr:LysR family transcriptional regulator [Paraoerskovia sediminicola]BDZ43077.1 LysR family transcriptional regulator [Paraoerskovia sediminicola]
MTDGFEERRGERTGLAALEILVAAGSHGSISAAARSLAISQPTASASLRRLERRLGVELLARSTRGATLTPDGRAAAAWAREVVDASDRFERSVSALQGAPTARIRVAASLTIAEHLAPRWITALAADPSAPQDVELVVRNSAGVMDLVLAEDVALGFVESSRVRPGLRSRKIADDELVVVVAAGHPWARRRQVTVPQLLAGGLVVRERGSGTREILERALEAAGEKLPGHLPYLGSTAALVTAVRHSGAVAVVSGLAVADAVAAGALVRVPVPGIDLQRSLRAVWKDGSSLPAAVRRIAAVAGAG